MFLSKPLELRSVCEYPEPRYPTHDGLDEALATSGEPGHSFVAPMITSVVVASLSSTGCTRTPAQAEPQASPAPVLVAEPAAPSAPVASETVEPEPVVPAPIATPNPDHPFGWAASQLPIEWHPYGTGAPMRLSEEKARAVIERVFAEAGVRLAPDVSFRRDGVAGELDGYDARKKVGYEFVEWRDLEDPTGFRGKAHGQNGDDFEKMFSHDEIKRVIELDANGAEHVIVVSFQDDRFSYPSWGRPDGGRGPEQMEENLRDAVRAYVASLKAQGVL